MTQSDAHADHIERARFQARGCVAIAVGTLPQIAADLIDEAILHERNARTRGGYSQA